MLYKNIPLPCNHILYVCVVKTVTMSCISLVTCTIRVAVTVTVTTPAIVAL